jgi:hypothetical protein
MVGLRETMMVHLVDRMLRLFGSRAEAARVCGCHPSAASHWARRHGVIPPLRIAQLQAEAVKRGFGHRFDADALLALAEARTATHVENRRRARSRRRKQAA